MFSRRRPKSTGSRSAGGRAGRRPRRAWTRYGDARLLDLRLRDLDLRVEGTWLEPCIERLYEELEGRGVRFRPHVWLSNEWFSPDGIPGIAVPFYLAHERLIQLERQQMLEVEGGSRHDCMRLLRHEAGHAIDSAYRLHRTKAWRETFGRFTEPYPSSYRPRPNSRSYVLHLDAWYAQAHPAEDYAETFAVWLTPRSGWKQRYRDWPKALRKLRYVDSAMREQVIDRPPPVRSRARMDPCGSSSMTLRHYYARKRRRYETEGFDDYDRDLRRIFSDDPRYRSRPSASGFLRSVRTEIRATVAEWTGVHTYAIDQILRDMIERCRKHRLRLAVRQADAKTKAVLMLTVQTMDSIRVGRYEVPV